MDASRFRLSPIAIPPDKWVAVCVYRTQGCTLHAGIAYRDATKHLRMLHFAWHLKLMDQSCRDGKVGCAIPLLDPLDSADEKFIAGFCGRIARTASRRNIPYNLKADADVRFDQATGEVQFGPNSTGLSCATFVVAVFRSAGNDLIDQSQWPIANTDDIAVQIRLVAGLGAGDQSQQDQAKRIEPEIGSPRIRPDQIVGACLESSYPVKYGECDINGKWIVAQLELPATSPLS